MLAYFLKIPTYVWFIGSTIGFCVGEYYSKLMALNPSTYNISAVIISYSFCTLFWVPAMIQKNSLTILGMLWSIMTILTTVWIGCFIFKEQLSVMNYVGLFFGIIAIIFLSL